MADVNGKPSEEDWEYEDEDADDYEWEYESEEEEEEVNGNESKQTDAMTKSEREEMMKKIAEYEQEIEEKGDLQFEKSSSKMTQNNNWESSKQTDAPLTKADREEMMKKIAEYEYEDEDEEDEDDEDEDDEIPDPFSAQAAAKNNVTAPTNGNHANGSSEENGKKKHKKHKKSSRLDRIEYERSLKEKGKSSEDKGKKIHVRSKDPLRIARQFEKAEKKSSSSSSSKNYRKSESNGKKFAPPKQTVNQICKVCGKEPYLVERIIAEKSWWHKNCFRCSVCKKVLNLDSYMSHEGILFCKPHHKELFMPKVAKESFDVENVTKSQEAIMKHQEAQRRMETIVRENNPVELEGVVKCSTNEKYSGLENLDVGSKFQMFEKAEEDDRGPSSDRYGIMEKLKRLQEGADLDDLLAEMDEELPSDEEEEEYDEETAHLTEVQKKSKNTEKLFSEDVKKHKKDESTRRELQALRKRLNCGGTSNAVDAFDDLLNSSSNKVIKTKVDVRSENAAKFRDMFDKGEVPEGKEPEKEKSEKDAELEQMRKNKREQREYFKMMEAGKLDEQKTKEPKMLVGKFKDATDQKERKHKMKNENDEQVENMEDLPELASLSNRFNYFENFNDDTGDSRKKSKDESHEAESARRECKASSVLNKFKEMENKVLNGEDDVPPPPDPDKPVISALGFLGKLPGVKERPLKRFTPPRKGLRGGDSETESGSDYSDSEYSDSSYTSSYTHSSDSDSEDQEDETLKAIRNAQRAKELRAKFEEWEDSQDAKDQMAQMSAYDENGEPLETASILRRKFEALRMHEEKANATPPPIKAQFRPKRFK